MYANISKIYFNDVKHSIIKTLDSASRVNRMNVCLLARVNVNVVNYEFEISTCGKFENLNIWKVVVELFPQ